MIRLEDHVREVPDFPKKGIKFKDIMPMLQSPEAFRTAIESLGSKVPRPDAVVGIESRGFLFGAPLALHWQVPFVPARKFGKLLSNLEGHNLDGMTVQRIGEDSTGTSWSVRNG